MKFVEFKSSLQKKRLENNYFFFGSDPYLSHQARGLLIAAIQEASEGGLHLDTMDLEETSLDELLNAAKHLPMFGRRQMIQVNGFMKLRENQGKKLEAYLKDPSHFTWLLFWAGDLSREDKEKKIFKILEAGTRMVEISPLGESEVKRWIVAKFKASGFAIEPEAANFLQDAHGNNLERLSHEIEKLTLYAGAAREITLLMMEEAAGFSRVHTINEFLDAIAGKEKLKALKLVQEMMSDSSEMLYWISLLSRQLRQLLQIREIEGKLGVAEVGRQIGLYNRFSVDKLISQSKHFSQKSLVSAICRLAMLDDRIKSSSADTKVFAELLIHDLTS